MKAPLHLVLILPALGLLAVSSNVSAAQPGTQSNPVISGCDQPFMFGFGSWEKAKTDFATRPDGIHISAVNAQGGAGVAGLSLKLAEFGDWTPALTLTVSEQNKAGLLNLHLTDADGTSHTYKFGLRQLQPGVSQRVTAEFGASLAEPQNVEKPGETPGLQGVVNCMVIGDWSGNAVEVVL